MRKEIGSNFWIEPQDVRANKADLDIATFGIQGTNVAWTSTGRSAIKTALMSIITRQPNVQRKALLPAFTCHSVIEPFLQMDFEVNYMPLSHHLHTTAYELTEAVHRTHSKVVLFHPYFGFHTLTDIDDAIENLRKEGVVFIEDCTQCLYSTWKKSDADYHTGSIRKWLGTPDGGFVVCREGQIEHHPTEYDKTLEQAKVQACEAKYAYMERNEGVKADFLHQYGEAEDILGSQTRIYTICPTSRTMQANLDVEFLKRRRRTNYRYLAERLSNRLELVFPTLPEDVCPLYFPIYAEERARLQSYLRENNVFAPVVWPSNDYQKELQGVPANMYQHMLCIPIDQRYALDDMQRITELIERYQ